MAKKEIKELINHLKEYKDAVVIVGSKLITKVKEGTEDEEFPEKIPVYFKPSINNKEVFSRKSMVKNPKLFWKYYDTNVLRDKDNELTKSYDYIAELSSMGLIKSVFDFNSDGFLYPLLDEKSSNIYVPIRGQQHILQCVKCGEKISIDDIPNYDTIEKPITHDQCGGNCKGKIKPTIPFYGEKYEQDDITALFKNIFEYNDKDEAIGLCTHTLILIGVDLLDDLIDEIMFGFNRFKRNDKFTVFICENSDMMMNDYQADFGTTYEHAKSLEKLIKMLKE